jgi:hypothetical protein
MPKNNTSDSCPHPTGSLAPFLLGAAAVIIPLAVMVIRGLLEEQRKEERQR